MVIDKSGTFDFSNSVSGNGALVQNGPGTTLISAANSYTGGTILNAGTLVVDNAAALGDGNVKVMGGSLTADPQPINVAGNYIQGSNGTLQLQVGGANPGQYDYLSVRGNATLGGTLQLIGVGGFQPKAGETLTIVKTGGLVSSAFQHVDPFTSAPGLGTIELVYNKNSVVLDFLNQTPSVITKINFPSFALTANQLAAADLLNVVQPDPGVTNLINYFFQHPFTELPSDFDQISPEALSAFYEVSFSSANLQRLTLEGRMDDIRNGSTGFSSNVQFNNGAPSDQKSVTDGKTIKNPVEPILQPAPENRWGIWLNGFGDFVTVDSDFNARGYRFTTGGLDLGADYRILSNLALGVMGDYAHTWTDLRLGTISVNSGRGGLYATYFNGRGGQGGTFYLNGGVYGGYNTYDSSRRVLGDTATGSTDGEEWSAFASGGYDFHFGRLIAGPVASLQYTNVYVSGFTETGSLAPLHIHSDSEESLRSDLGFRASYHWQLGRVVVAPYVTAAWEHEFKYSTLPVTAGLAAIPGPDVTFVGPAEGQDSAVISAGASIAWTPAISTYVGYDGQLGRTRYDSNAVSGGVRFTF